MSGTVHPRIRRHAHPPRTRETNRPPHQRDRPPPPPRRRENATRPTRQTPQPNQANTPPAARRHQRQPRAGTQRHQPRTGDRNPRGQGALTKQPYHSTNATVACEDSNPRYLRQPKLESCSHQSPVLVLNHPPNHTESTDHQPARSSILQLILFISDPVLLQ